MSQVEQLELGLWKVLQEATISPDAANLGQLLDGLDAVLLGLDTVGQLQVAAEVISQIAQVFCDRSTLAFEELEATNIAVPDRTRYNISLTGQALQASLCTSHQRKPL